METVEVRIEDLEADGLLYSVIKYKYNMADWNAYLETKDLKVYGYEAVTYRLIKEHVKSIEYDNMFDEYTVVSKSLGFIGCSAYLHEAVQLSVLEELTYPNKTVNIPVELANNQLD